MRQDLPGPLTVIHRQAEIGPIRDLGQLLTKVAVAAWATYLLTALTVTVWPGLGVDRAVLDVVDPTFLNRGSLTYWLAYLGSAPLLGVVAGVACAYLAFLRRTPIAAAVLAGGYAFSCLMVTVGKRLVRRPSPTQPLDELGFAFPSGHSASALVVWGGLALTLYLADLLDGSPSRQRGAFAFAGSMVAVVSAMLLLRSAHWLTDLVGGIALGLASLATTGAVILRLWLAYLRPAP